MQAFARLYRNEEELFEYLDLVAVSIASDIVPIVDENRILCYHGLKKLNENPLPGLKALKDIPHAAMAVTTDVGSELKIHPPDKTTVARRLGYIALAKTYGKKGMAYESPVYRSIKITGNKAIISFDHAENGLTSKGKELSNFEIAGTDKIFHPAKAIIIPGRKVEVTADNVSSPTAVRYAFKNWVVGTLYNTEGLPASSFRTDHWDIPPFIFSK
jgi:sialate O-acetylesterase